MTGYQVGIFVGMAIGFVGAGVCFWWLFGSFRDAYLEDDEDEAHRKFADEAAEKDRGAF